MVVEIATGYSALKSAYEIARGLKDINDRVALNAAVIDLQEKILSAQETASNAKARMREMQEALDRYDNWDETASRYALRDFGGDTFAYEAKADALEGNPPHLTCPNCFQQRKLSILQYKGKYQGRRRFDCQACDKSVDLGVIVQPQSSPNPYRPF